MFMVSLNIPNTLHVFIVEVVISHMVTVQKFIEEVSPLPCSMYTYYIYVLQYRKLVWIHTYGLTDFMIIMAVWWRATKKVEKR